MRTNPDTLGTNLLDYAILAFCLFVLLAAYGAVTQPQVTVTVSPEIVLVDTVTVPGPPQEWLPAFGLECRWVPAGEEPR